MCKKFTITFYDGAYKWFNKLAPQTITTFSQFVRMFIPNYTYNKPFKKESHHLFLIIEGGGESIEEYMRRFREEKLDKVDFPSSITIEAFRRGLLKKINFFVEMTTTVPKTLEEGC